MLGVLGLKILLVEDLETAARMVSFWEKRERPDTYASNGSMALIKRMKPVVFAIHMAVARAHRNDKSVTDSPAKHCEECGTRAVGEKAQKWRRLNRTRADIARPKPNAAGLNRTRPAPWVGPKANEARATSPPAEKNRKRAA